MATKATLINSSGQKVVVESGSTQAQDYFSKGYKLMTAPSSSPSPASPAVPGSPAPAPVQPAAGGGSPAPAASPAVAPAGAPAVNPTIDTKTAKNANGELINPTGEDVSKFNEKYSTTTPEYANKPGIAALLASGRPFTEEDAKNLAYAKGETNYQKYIGATGGQVNDTYIGSENWSKLQKQYTPYQLSQATVRTNYGIYWKDGININDVPRIDPAQQINDDTKVISDLVTDAKKEADKTISNKAKSGADLTGDAADNKQDVMNLLNNLYSDTAEDVYNQLFKTPEMKTAQEELLSAQQKLDEYDQQLEDLKNDIRKEVEGEASESYISAKAAVRGEDILKLKRSAQRDYDLAAGRLTVLKEEAQNLLNVRTADSNNRYNRMFSMLQLQIQQEGTQFNQNMAILNASMQIPKGRTITVGGVTIKGMNEDANLNVVQFTEADGSTYVIGIDKNTGEQKYKQFIGKAKVSGSGGADTAVKQLAEYEATRKLTQYQNLDASLAKPVTESGSIRTAVDDKGKTFYYDAYALDQAQKNSKWWRNDKVDPVEHLLYYAN